MPTPIPSEPAHPFHDEWSPVGADEPVEPHYLPEGEEWPRIEPPLDPAVDDEKPARKSKASKDDQKGTDEEGPTPVAATKEAAAKAAAVQAPNVKATAGEPTDAELDAEKDAETHRTGKSLEQADAEGHSDAAPKDEPAKKQPAKKQQPAKKVHPSKLAK